MRVFIVEYFSSLDWREFNRLVLAEDEQQVRTWVERECEVGFRKRSRYSPTSPPPHRVEYDTLKIIDSGPAELPYLIADL